MKLSHKVLMDVIWHHLQVLQDYPYPTRLQEETLMIGGVLTKVDLNELFTEGSQGCSIPSETCREYPCPTWLQEETWMIGGVSTWFLRKITMNFLQKDSGMLHPIWNLSGMSCSPRLQKVTWRIGEVLIWLLMSVGCALPSYTIFRSIRNEHVHLNFRKRLWGCVESLYGSWCQILMKFSKKVLMDTSCHQTPSPGQWLLLKSIV